VSGNGLSESNIKKGRVHALENVEYKRFRINGVIHNRRFK